MFVLDQPKVTPQSHNNLSSILEERGSDLDQ